MPASDKIPYPAGPDPEDVPDDLTAFPRSYVTQEWLLLASQVLFLLIYLALVLVAGGAALLFALAVRKIPAVLAILGVIGSGLLFLFLVKGLFRRPTPPDEELSLRITEDDQPTLFAFIDRICEETGADRPRKVILTWDVNAAVVPQVTLASLLVPPRKDLIIGLALVNSVTLAEFKSILAHEFGHFTQRDFAAANGNVVNSVIVNVLMGQDWFDRVVAKDGGAFSTILGAGPRAVSWMLIQAHKVFAYGYYQLRREQEFHADLVAVSLAGSDAATHALLKSRFGAEAFEQALEDLKKAADHRLYTADLYFHQHAAVEVVRRLKKDAQRGRTPTLASPMAGKAVQVFPPDGDYDGQTVGGHPNDHEREENAKRRFVYAPADERSPWILFRDPAPLREAMTYKVYRTWKKVPRGTILTDPRGVQKFIDEHRETTYDPKYDGLYDDRLLQPGSVDELNALIRKEPWPDERVLGVYVKLYADAKGQAAARQELADEREKVLRTTRGTAGRRARRILKDLEEKLAMTDGWFHSLDRRVYLVFVQMAYRVDNELYYDLVNRYRFHHAIQEFYRAARDSFGQSLFLVNTAFEQDGPVSHDDFIELTHVLRKARSTLRKIVREARNLDMPAMKNFEESDRLADFLLDGEVVRDLPGGTGIDGKWVTKLLKQLEQVLNKAARLHAKSLGGILRLQDEIAGKYLAKMRK